MNDRIHSALDGDLPRSLLSPGEEAELAQVEAAIAAAAERLEAANVPDLSARIMESLPREHGAGFGARAAIAHAWAWIWTPRQVAMRPAAGLALAALLLLMLPIRSAVTGPAESPRSLAEESTPAAVFVQFRLEVPGATHVSLAGSFTGWEARYELHEVVPGLWSALIPLQPGVHDYLYIVDGHQWVPDPLARPVEDGFGGINSRLFLVPPSEAV